MLKTKNGKTLAALAALAILAAAAALISALTDRRTADPGREVRVYLDGTLYATEHLGAPHELTVRGQNGEVNVIALDEEGVWMKSSTCHNQLCVHQGKVTYENYASRYYGTDIICLPNRVTVELVLRDGEQDPDAPDV